MPNEYNVLVVDDSAFAQKVITSFLADTEFKVAATANNGKDAVEAFKSSSPAIVLLDVILPDARGSEILASIMEIDPEAKVLMVSSLGTEDTVTQCLAAGAKNFVQKPVDRDALLKQMRAIIVAE